MFLVILFLQTDIILRNAVKKPTVLGVWTEQTPLSSILNIRSSENIWLLSYLPIYKVRKSNNFWYCKSCVEEEKMFQAFSNICEKRLLALSYRPVCPYVPWNNSALTGRIFLKSCIREFYWNRYKNTSLLKSGKNIRHFTWRPNYILHCW
jgi:hypothetical protein